MQKAVYGVIAALAAVVVDRLLKAAALHGLSFLFASWFKFELFMNYGIAFSLPVAGPVVWIASAAIIVGAAAVAVRDVRTGRYARITPLALFALGAAANLYDRLAYGFTADYLIFFGRSAVNVADGMIIAGALWLALRPTPLPQK